MTDRPTWPAERFYWAVLDAPGAGRPGELPPGLSAMLEDDAPIRACDVHAVGVPLAGDRLAVCAAERRELADLPAGVLSLCPAGLPAFLEGEGVAPDRFNLLVGMYEPRPYRLARIRRHAVAAAVVVLCGLLVCVGLLRREAHWRARAESTPRRWRSRPRRCPGPAPRTWGAGPRASAARTTRWPRPLPRPTRPGRSLRSCTSGRRACPAGRSRCRCRPRAFPSRSRSKATPRRSSGRSRPRRAGRSRSLA